MIKRLILGNRGILAEDRGDVAAIVATSMVMIVSVAAVSIDAGMLYIAKAQLQRSANLAAMAGAQDINCCANAPGTAITTAIEYSAAAGQKNADGRFSAGAPSGYPILKCLKNVGISCGGADNANAIVVKQTATVPLLFARIFGKESKTISATATAVGTGGKGISYDIMLVLDTTASMNSADSSCSVSGSTSLVCALLGAQTLLKSLSPSLVNVGLMIFPGVQNTTHATYEYDCRSSPDPTVVSYRNNPVYTILPMSNNYKVSDDVQTLNPNSNLVRAVRGGATGCQQGVEAIGGVGTYFTDVITAAQNYLTANARVGAQKVIIFLSDGDAGASSSNVPTGKSSNQCRTAITAAAAATAAGTWIYSAAYGASTSTTGSCPTNSPKISACSTMQQIASKPTLFFAAKRAGATGCTSPANGSSDLISAFVGIGQKLSPPRLVPNNTV